MELETLLNSSWEILEIRDRWGTYCFVDRKHGYREFREPCDRMSEIFHFYFDNILRFSLTEKGFIYLLKGETNGRYVSG